MTWRGPAGPLRQSSEISLTTPPAVYHGTFSRAPEEPHPPEDPVEWKDYDPNWREFIGTVFIVLLLEDDTLLPESLRQKMWDSIRLAAEGAYMRKVRAEYTNISLMSAFLLDHAGAELDNSEWRAYASGQAQKIYDLFNRNETFDEYNSPTYYGVDLYALVLWRVYGLTQEMRRLGETMERKLWQDIAQYYHAGLRNICGPYDRSYGMDMTGYLALIGLWIATVVPPEQAPLPNVDQPFDHAHDFFYMPVFALIGAQIPDEALPHLTAFQGERLVERTIETDRTVSAWIGENLLLGAEADHLNPARSNQFHPVTAHWRTPDGSIGWIRTRSASIIRAEAQPNELRLSGEGEMIYVFEIRAAGATAEMIGPAQWSLPGLTVEVLSENAHVSVEGEIITVEFSSATPLTMRFR